MFNTIDWVALGIVIALVSTNIPFKNTDKLLSESNLITKILKSFVIDIVELPLIWPTALAVEELVWQK